jgi:hypothetical protein
VTPTRLLGVLFAGAAGAVLVVACTFPDVGFRPDTSGGGGAGASPLTGSGAGASVSSGSSGSSGHAGSSTTSASSSASGTSSTGGASTSSSSSTSTTSSGCVDPSQPCDCDGDGDNANTPECDQDGGDCNDHDPLVNSKQTMWFTQPGSNGWDYNCDNVSEFEYPDFLSCGALSACDSSTQKWTGGQPEPGCGEMGQYGTCAGIVFFHCYEQAQGMRAQGCH